MPTKLGGLFNAWKPAKGIEQIIVLLDDGKTEDKKRVWREIESNTVVIEHEGRERIARYKGRPSKKLKGIDVWDLDPID